ncbi:transporter substrate-binding domain-containing protein [Deinococcus metallilatus]|uniref:Cystine transport system substrate-binding protein n=2 Tax=Deinococcus TaxID=1298 RepID=A0AAJ5F472_9DEIO|nr:transporter substrate-binding domain-containing protein [Deinococcus metallilatus]MBB5295505.1 cystine transport system substrate-binding protein [Deinococcus metallilatus]QBY07980.1 transporter substrate-binding domain-containing protein [Deinococcus metallilatus]RXJ12873.1 transporter substrate-binding domain-containing protein [Deinococcus metallilatus]TLK27205.1 transporter substrate-binding domain-containing protein [Deinococcus metallilatus]GMA16183.1 cysteine ABC transporter substrat
MRHLTLLTALALTAGLSAQAAAPTLTPGVLKIAMEGTYPPFTFKDAQGQLTGFDVDIARAVAAKLGLRPEFVLTEWSGILAGLQANKYDVIVNQVGITPERQKSIGFSQPYAYSRPQIIVRKSGNFSPKTLADLKGKRVGVGLGSNFEKQLRDAGGINVVTYPGAPEYLADLAAGRLDAAYNDRLLVGYLITKDRLPIRGAGVIGQPEPVGIAFKKTNAALGNAINRALLQIKADGTYAKISRKWFGEDVSKP